MITRSFCFEIYQIYFMTLCLERKKKSCWNKIRSPDGSSSWCSPHKPAFLPHPRMAPTNQMPEASDINPDVLTTYMKKCERRQFHFSAGRDCKCSANTWSDYLYLKHVAETQVSNLRGDALEIVALARSLAWWSIKGFSAFPSIQQVNGICLSSLYWAVNGPYHCSIKQVLSSSLSGKTLFAVINL